MDVLSGVTMFYLQIQYRLLYLQNFSVNRTSTLFFWQSISETKKKIFQILCVQGNMYLLKTGHEVKLAMIPEKLVLVEANAMGNEGSSNRGQYCLLHGDSVATLNYSHVRITHAAYCLSVLHHFFGTWIYNVQVYFEHTLDSISIKFGRTWGCVVVTVHNSVTVPYSYNHYINWLGGDP